MAAKKIERKLAAILAADVAGYSRLMSRGEEATFRQLKAYRAVIDYQISGHRGRIFGSAGDSIVAEFSNSNDAVLCAVSIQRALFERNATLSSDRHMNFRIGVHLGAVMIEGDNLFGDAVNIAARLEGLSDPGGVCVSEDIYRQVSKKLELQFVNLGSKRVKNILRPIRVYGVIDSPIARKPPITNDIGTTPETGPTLPAYQPPIEAADAPTVERILVVDDDPQVREFLQDYLSEYGYDVSTAESAHGMRADLAKRIPDIVLLDVGLPGEDGLSLARYLRERFDIGVIMISGAGEPLDRIVGLEVGADDYVTKPFDPRELRARLRRVLGRYRQR